MKNFKFKLNEKEYEVEILNVDDGTAELKVNGTRYAVDIDRYIKTTKTPKLTRSAAVPATESDAANIRTGKPDDVRKAAVRIKAPLPGKIIDVMVEVGDSVSLGQVVVCLEAMKMENNISSDKEGVVTAVRVNKGDTIMEGDVLIELG